MPRTGPPLPADLMKGCRRASWLHVGPHSWPQQQLAHSSACHTFLPRACPASPVAGTALCYPQLFVTRWTGESQGLLKIWKVSRVTFKACRTETATTSQNRNKVWTKRINNEDRIIPVLQSFLTPTNCFAPAICRGPCCEILSGLETFKKRR